MSNTWQYQVRFVASEALAQALRETEVQRAHKGLHAILQAHGASIRCQYDAFADYVNEAERLGTHDYPLYAWTRATIENPEKKQKYLRAFTVYVDAQEVYDKMTADALATSLRRLAGDGDISNVVMFDSNPAHNPQPPANA